MTTLPINSDTVDIPSVNFAQQGSDVAAPAAGRWQLFFKSGGLYARSNAGGVIGPFLVSAAALTIAEIDGVPSGTPTTLQFPNGTVSDQGGGTYRYTPAGALTIAEIDGVPSGTPTTLQFPNGTVSDQGGGTYRYTPAAGSGDVPVGAEVSRATNFAVAQNTWTSIEFATEVRDDDGMVDLGTQPTRVTIPRAGWYIMKGEFTFASYSGGTRYGRFYVNGTTKYWMQEANAGSSGILPCYGSNVVYLALNDYVEMQAFQSPTASLNVTDARLVVLGFKPS